jgi:hypothetical protein
LSLPLARFSDLLSPLFVMTVSLIASSNPRKAPPFPDEREFA